MNNYRSNAKYVSNYNNTNNRYTNNSYGSSSTTSNTMNKYPTRNNEVPYNNGSYQGQPQLPPPQSLPYPIPSSTYNNNNAPYMNRITSTSSTLPRPQWDGNE